jgi:hypothetical protein
MYVSCILNEGQHRVDVSSEHSKKFVLTEGTKVDDYLQELIYKKQEGSILPTIVFVTQ